MLIEWNDDHALGIELVDAGHHLVIETVNRLNEATTQAQCHGVVDQMLPVLHQHLTRQFELEGVRLSRDPTREAHLAEHADLLDVLATLRHSHTTGIDVADMLLLNLICFLGQHLRGVDRMAFARPLSRAA